MRKLFVWLLVIGLVYWNVVPEETEEYYKREKEEKGRYRREKLIDQNFYVDERGRIYRLHIMPPGRTTTPCEGDCKDGRGRVR